MTRRRKILLGLLALAAVMVIAYFVMLYLDAKAIRDGVWPPRQAAAPGMELLCLVYAVPVTIVNMWEWVEPEFEYW